MERYPDERHGHPCHANEYKFGITWADEVCGPVSPIGATRCYTNGGNRSPRQVNIPMRVGCGAIHAFTADVTVNICLTALTACTSTTGKAYAFLGVKRFAGPKGQEWLRFTLTKFRNTQSTAAISLSTWQAARSLCRGILSCPQPARLTALPSSLTSKAGIRSRLSGWVAARLTSQLSARNQQVM